MIKVKQVPETAEDCHILRIDDFSAHNHPKKGDIEIYHIEGINKDTFKNAINLKEISISDMALLDSRPIALDLSNCSKLERIVIHNHCNSIYIDLTKTDNQINNVINIRDILVYNEKDRGHNHYSFDINNGPLIIDRSVLSIPNIVIYFSGNSKFGSAGLGNGSGVVSWTNTISMAPILFNNSLTNRIKLDPKADPLYIDRSPIYMDPVRVCFEPVKDEETMIKFNSEIMKQLLNPATKSICIRYIEKYNKQDKKEGLAIIPRKDQGLNDWIIYIDL